jgi:SAM-dependent methyltransferase
MSLSINLSRGWLEQAHGEYVFARRVRVLSQYFAALLPQAARVLDIGCGDGSIAALIGQQRPDVTITGIDVLVRPQTQIPVAPFDGAKIPYDDRSFDAVMFVDVLHHTDDPLILLREAARVARTAIVLKDHARDGWLAAQTLRLMDYVGNAHHGVALPYNYWSERQWREAFAALALCPSFWKQDLQLYPWPGSWLFERSLHFIAKLECSA